MDGSLLRFLSVGVDGIWLKQKGENRRGRGVRNGDENLGKLKATWAKWREQVTRKTIITLTRLGSGGKGISCFGFKKVPSEQFIHSFFIQGNLGLSDWSV